MGKTKKCTTKLDILHRTEQDLDEFITIHVNEKTKETIRNNFKETTTTFFDLPDSVQVQILNFLPYVNLLHCRQVCTKLQDLVESALSTKFHSVTVRISDNMDYRPWQMKKTKNKGHFPWPWKRKPEDCKSNEDDYHHLPKLKIRAQKMIVNRLMTQLFDNHNTRLLNIVENVKEIHFLGLISGRNFQRIFESCPNVEIVRFNIASHGGPMDTPFRTLFKQWPWKPVPKLRTIYEWPYLRELVFDHSCETENIEKVSKQLFFSFLTYFNRGILTNRILCETPGIQVFTKPEWDAFNNAVLISEGMGIVLLRRLNQEFYFLLHKELLKITLLVNILCLTPISLTSILRDAHEIY